MSKKLNHIVYKLEMEAYKGNKELEEIYTLLYDKNQNYLILKCELNKIRSRITFIEENLDKLSFNERNFIYDVYYDDIYKHQIIKKYNLNKNEYDKYIDSILSKIFNNKI